LEKSKDYRIRTTALLRLRHRNLSRCAIALLLGFSFGCTQVFAQAAPTDHSTAEQELFRLERVPVEGGAELLTILARVTEGDSPNEEWVPMVSVLRDTLGDGKTENDRLRYLWALTYTRPTFWQKVTGAVPFLYSSVGSKHSSDRNPPPLMDLASADRDVWNRLCWYSMQTLLLDPYGTPIRASSRSYQRNISDFRKSHIIRALSLLTLYQKLGHEKIFTDEELKEIQARLMLTDKPFGGLVDDLKLAGFYEKQSTKVEVDLGHNWELLRQQAEANGLYFEPLEMPDGSSTHAMLWIAKSELSKPPAGRWEGR
jgi:hypothetical protein